MTLNYVTLTLDLVDGQGYFPVSGTATFTPSAVLTDAGVEIIGQQPIVAAFHASGQPSVRLLATDNSAPQPAGWTWTVAFSGVTGAPAAFSFFLAFANGATQLLSSLIPVSSGTAFQAYMPLPSGTATSGYVPVATGTGETSAWGPQSGGGFSNPMTTLGDIIYENATPAAARLAGDTSNTRKFLRTQASGGIAQAPAWDTVQAGDVPTLNQNTTGTAANVTGTVAIANGGTGQTTAAAALAALGALAEPTLTETATLYVTTDGNDSNDGLTWRTGKATVNAALAALPVVGGQTLGTVQLGAGAFAPFTISNTMTVTVRGIGPGQGYDNTNNINSPQRMSYINNTGTGVGVTIQGPSVFGPSGGPVPFGVILQDFSIVGNASSSDGVFINKTEGVVLRNLIIDQCATWGLHIEQVYGIEADSVTITRCGTSGASGFSGGMFVDASQGQNNGFLFTFCNFISNFGEGFYSVNGTDLTFVECFFENNAVSARSGSGSGITLANNVSGFPATFIGCWFENNARYGANITGSTRTVATFNGCQFPGDNVQLAGINVTQALVVNVIGCNFQQHSSGFSIVNTAGNGINWIGCFSLDSTAFIQGYTGFAGQNTPVGAAVAFGCQQTCIIGTSTQTTLGSNGAVTMNAANGNVFTNTLNANATSSSITNPSTGQVITISWIQGASGSFTYAWPASCKFAAGSAPSASTTAGFRDSVTFAFDGVGGNWYEISRAVGVH